MKKKTNKFKESAYWIIAITAVIVFMVVFGAAVWIVFDWFMTNMLDINILNICHRFGLPGWMIMISVPLALIIMLAVLFYGMPCTDFM